MKKNILTYFKQVLILFSAAIITVVLLSLLFGKTAQNYSSLFILGNTGISNHSLVQLFAISVFVVGVRALFTLEKTILKTPFPLRIGGMLFIVSLIVFALAIVFGWFPYNSPYALIFGIGSFGSVFLISSVIIRKSRKKTALYSERLAKYKGGDKQ